MTRNPLVSVVVACHDGDAFLAAALDSALAQTHERLEIVAVDDASRDGTAELLNRYVAAEPDRIVVVRRNVNEGPCRARRVGFERARGEFLCWLDQDDLWEPDKVEQQVALMRRRPDVGLVYSYFDAFDSASGALIAWPDGRRDFEGDVLAPLFVEGCFIGSITTMVRREALATRDLRIRDSDFSFGDDYYLWLGLALDWQVARIPRVLAHYRRHAGNESSRLEHEFDVNLWRVRLLDEFLAEYPDAVARLGRARRAAFARHHGLAAIGAVRAGQYRRGLRYALRSVATDPLLGPRRARAPRR